MSNQPHASSRRSAERRFGFGRNWARFLKRVDDGRIRRAERSLARMLEVDDLAGRSFLDIGSGSGLFSLAARRLGAKVHSFDYDPQSVACTEELRRRFRADDDPADWHVEQGSALDRDYLASLGPFDVVYSWGVLHHTGAMREAMDAVTACVRPGGVLYVALYNDQGKTSARWRRLKRLYNALPRFLRFLVLWPAFLRLWGPTMIRDLVRLRPCHTWRHYDSVRGMSAWRDVVDWVGGYPFEVATPEAVTAFYAERGLGLVRLNDCGTGHGCNEFVFRRATDD